MKDKKYPKSDILSSETFAAIDRELQKYPTDRRQSTVMSALTHCTGRERMAL